MLPSHRKMFPTASLDVAHPPVNTACHCRALTVERSPAQRPAQLTQWHRASRCLHKLQTKEN